jgi:hypothetical protein
MSQEVSVNVLLAYIVSKFGPFVDTTESFEKLVLEGGDGKEKRLVISMVPDTDLIEIGIEDGN